jgi:hypothetical protein
MVGGKGCADISSISVHKTEEEVLVARGARLRVKSWDEAAKTLKVVLEGTSYTAKTGKDAAPDPLAELDEVMSKSHKWDITSEPHVDGASSLVDRWAADDDFGLGVVLDDEE